MEEEAISFKEQRIKKVLNLYYSRPDIQKAIFKFCKNRETIPKFLNGGFGKRPDVLEYPGDVLAMVKKGATSFNCSEEIWKDPLKIQTGMKEGQLNELRSGWDFIIDIDSKYIDYSKIMAKLIIEFLRFHGIKNIGVKFSVSGGTPILIKDKEKISLIPILDAINRIKKGEKLKALSLDKNYKIKFSKIYGFLEHKDTLYEIKHSQSILPLRVTKHHSVFIWNKGEIIEKKVSDIKKGDFLISYNSKENPFSENKIKVINKFEFSKNQFNKKIVKKEIKITKELMRLIGYFLAEGHVTNIINQTGFTFHKNEIEYIEDVKNLLNLITKRKISIRRPNPNSTQILIHSKEWAAFFDNFCGKKKEKHIPSFAWSSSRELFLEMLKGYIRGEGYKVGKYGIVIKSVSKRLITELIWLCKLNGISCNFSYEKNKPHQLPQGTFFKGSLIYMIRIPKSELENFEFHRKRNKFSPYAGDRTFPVDGLRLVYKQIKPRMFKTHRTEQMTLSKKQANLNRIRKVLDWFYNFKSIEPDKISKKMLSNYERLFNSDITAMQIKEIIKKEKEMVYDISVEKTEAFFGNYYPVLLHNSGSKGFHIIIPWKAFPKEINQIKTSDNFPEYPRIIVKYIMEKIKDKLIEKVSELERPNKYVKDYQAPKEVMPDLILVSPRHLYRTPYSLHEKTALASVVISPEEIESFELKEADPLKIEIKNFMPDAKEGEATGLLREALDWNKHNLPQAQEKKNFDFEPIKLVNLSDKNFPPVIKKILQGIADGRKRALFILINFFRSIGIERKELETRIYEWNEKNKTPLQEGYLKSQILWSYRNKVVLPPNFDKDYYKGIGIIPEPEELRFKNPVNYTIKKTFLENNNQNSKQRVSKKNK